MPERMGSGTTEGLATALAYLTGPEATFPTTLPLVRWLVVEGRALQQASPSGLAAWAMRLTAMGNACAHPATSEPAKWAYFQVVGWTALHGGPGPFRGHVKQCFNALLAYFQKPHDPLYARDVLAIACRLLLRVPPEFQKDASMTYLPKLMGLWMELLHRDEELLDLVDWPTLASVFREHAFLSRSQGERLTALLVRALEQPVKRASTLPGLVTCLVWVEHHLNHKAPGTHSLSRQLVCAVHRDLGALFGCVDEEGEGVHVPPTPTKELDLAPLPGGGTVATSGSSSMAGLLARLEALATLLSAYFTTFRAVPVALCLPDLLDLARRVHALSAASLPKTAAHRPDFQRLLLLLPKLKATMTTMVAHFLHGVRKALMGRAGDMAQLCLQALEDSRGGAGEYRVAALALLDATVHVFGVRAFQGAEAGLLRELLTDVTVEEEKGALASTGLACEPAGPSATTTSACSRKKRKYHSEKDDLLANPVPALRSGTLHAALRSLDVVLGAQLPLAPATQKRVMDHLLSCLLILSARLYTSGISQPALVSIHRAQHHLVSVLATIVTGERVSKAELIPVMRVLGAFLNHGNLEMEQLCVRTLTSLSVLLHPRLPPLRPAPGTGDGGAAESESATVLAGFSTLRTAPLPDVVSEVVEVDALPEHRSSHAVPECVMGVVDVQEQPAIVPPPPVVSQFVVESTLAVPGPVTAPALAPVSCGHEATAAPVPVPAISTPVALVHDEGVPTIPASSAPSAAARPQAPMASVTTAHQSDSDEEMPEIVLSDEDSDQ